MGERLPLKEKGKDKMSEYVVVVKLMDEAISLGAGSKEEAISKAREIIAEQYSEGVAKDATYTIEGE